MAGTQLPVIVLGAGLAGLRGALELRERGFDAELLEQLDELGGMARSHQVGDFIFDHGPHGFFSRDQWIMDEFKDLLGESGYRWITKWSQIHYRGEYFNYPLKLRDLASKLSPVVLLHAFLSYLGSRARLAITSRAPVTAEDHLTDQFGRVLYDEFFGPYTRKVWGIDPTELDADFTRDRVPTLHLWDVIRKLFTDPAKERVRATPSGRVQHELDTFCYPTRGARALPLAYARRLAERGVRFHYRVQLERIDLGRQEVVGRVDGVPFTLAFAGLLSTIPLDGLVRLLQPAAPPDIAALARNLRYRSVLLVNLCVRKPQVLGPLWIYYTNRFFNRISEYRNFSPALVPKGKTGICLEVGCDAGDALWNAEDSEIVRRCLPDLADLGLVKESEIEDYLVIRERNAYPIYDVGYRQRINRLVAWLEGETGILTAGRQGRFLYVNQDAAIRSGREAGAALAELLETGRTAHRPVWADERPRRKIIG